MDTVNDFLTVIASDGIHQPRGLRLDALRQGPGLLDQGFAQRAVPGRQRAGNRAVSLKVFDGELSPANARSLLVRLGVLEPADRSDDALVRIDVNFGNMGLDGTGWTAIHAVEDGWVAPGRERKGRTVYASLTPKALAHVASRQAKAA